MCVCVLGGGGVVIYKSFRCFLQSFKLIGLSVQEKKRKKDFQDGHHGSYLGFLIGRILAIFDLQVTLLLPAKFQVNWPNSSGEKVKKIDFQNGSHDCYLGFLIGMITAFLCTSRLDVSYQISSQTGLAVQEKT